jgi:hypothetical protein
MSIKNLLAEWDKTHFKIEEALVTMDRADWRTLNNAIFELDEKLFEAERERKNGTR